MLPGSDRNELSNKENYMSFDNTNCGALFKNERREKKTDADYRGTINIDGRDFWLNAWIKEVQGRR